MKDLNSKYYHEYLARAHARDVLSLDEIAFHIWVHAGLAVLRREGSLSYESILQEADRLFGAEMREAMQRYAKDLSLEP